MSEGQFALWTRAEPSAPWRLQMTECEERCWAYAAAIVEDDPRHECVVLPRDEMPVLAA